MIAYELEFQSYDGVLAKTHLTAECDIDALELANNIKNRRKRDGIKGTHTLHLPHGESIDLSQYDHIE